MVHPINQQFREYLETNILQAYKDELAKNPGGAKKPAKAEFSEED